MSDRGWLLLLLAACAGDKTTPSDSGGDADTDTDADSDADADADTDSDPVSLSGGIDYQRLVDGGAECVSHYDLVGTPYTGECPDCAFAFEITTTRTSSTGACAAPDNVMTLTPSDTVVNLKLALVESYDLGGDLVTNAVLWGHDLYYGGSTFPGPNWSPLGFEGSPGADVTWDGATLSIASLRAFTQSDFSHYLGMCGGTYVGAAVSSFAGGTPTDGELACDGQSFDLYAFEVAAGQTVQLQVDNGPAAVADDALAPFFSLTDASDCQIGHSVPSFACATQGAGGGLDCPSLEFTAPASGTYHVAVETADYYGLCSGGVGPYTVSGNADGTPLALSLVAGELPFFENPVDIEDSAALTATVSFGR